MNWVIVQMNFYSNKQKFKDRNLAYHCLRNSAWSKWIIYVLSHLSCVQLSATLWVVAHQAFLSMGFSRQESWSGLTFSPPGNLPNPHLLCLLNWQAGCLPLASFTYIWKKKWQTMGNPMDRGSWQAAVHIVEESYRTEPFFVVQSLNQVQLFATPQTAACQASLSINNSRRLLKLMSIELMIPSNHLIFCHPLLLLPSICPSIKVFSNKSALCIRWPRYWSFSMNSSND